MIARLSNASRVASSAGYQRSSMLIVIGLFRESQAPRRSA
jgi:hypothetical protein